MTAKLFAAVAAFVITVVIAAIWRDGKSIREEVDEYAGTDGPMEDPIDADVAKFSKN